jgi:ABC-type transport system involved in multi-copper enzyme maturation permease subunit
MLRKGTLDLTLARPIGRGQLLVGKYLGGLWYVGLLASFAIGGCWIALALGSGYSHPAFLVSIPSLVFSFAALYAVAVLIGVLTRSTGLSALVSAGVWFAASIVGGVRQALQTEEFLNPPAWVERAVDTAWLALPKIKDVDSLTAQAISDGHGASAELRRMAQVSADQIEPLVSLGTTAGFSVVVVGVAVWVFSRRDY